MNTTITTMTASWGGVGFLWHKPVSYIFIRPQRYYTKEFVDAKNALFPLLLRRNPAGYAELLRDQIGPRRRQGGGNGHHPGLFGMRALYFSEAKLVLLCKSSIASR